MVNHKGWRTVTGSVSKNGKGWKCYAKMDWAAGIPSIASAWSPDQAAFILGIFPLLLCQNDDFYLHADNRFNKLMLYLLFSVAPLTLVLTTRAEDSLSSDGLFLTLYKEKLFAEAYSRHFARVSAMEYRVIWSSSGIAVVDFDIADFRTALRTETRTSGRFHY